MEPFGSAQGRDEGFLNCVVETEGSERIWEKLGR